MAETIAVRRWVLSLLSNDPTMLELLPDIANRVHAYKAPSGASFPLITVGMQSARPDIMTAPLIRIAARPLFIIKVIGEGNDISVVEPLYNQVDTLLQGGSGSNSSGIVPACWRRQPIEYLEVTVQGVEYMHLGGLYNVIAQISP